MITSFEVVSVRQLR